jgi:DNA-binding NtrC family response regulator
MSPLVQAKFLRVLQEREFLRLGGTRPVRVDVRVIAATNASLEKEVRAGRFRQDLYYRLNEFTIAVPALRDRREDVAHLARRFLDEARVELGGPARTFSDEALRILAAHDWPGNVRELRNVIRRAALIGPAVVGVEHLRLHDRDAEAGVPSAPSPSAELPSLKAVVEQAVADAERRLIRQALRLAAGNKALAARMLATDYKTLLLKIKRHAIGEDDTRDKKGAEAQSS